MDQPGILRAYRFLPGYNLISLLARAQYQDHDIVVSVHRLSLEIENTIRKSMDLTDVYQIPHSDWPFPNVYQLAPDGLVKENSKDHSVLSLGGPENGGFITVLPSADIIKMTRERCSRGRFPGSPLAVISYFTG